NMETAMRMAEHEPYGVGIFFQDRDRLHYQEILRNLNKVS
ncbi:MAG: 2-oxoacid:ferredoxin oxidoreductase subunit beta, partial [Deltaproteobacteria bacterium]